MKNIFRKIKHDLVYWICCMILSIVSICLGVYLLNDVSNRYNEQQAIQKIRVEKQRAIENKESNKSDESNESDKEDSRSFETSTTDTDNEKILVEYKNLSKENDDLYGWITIEDTNIDFPVMFTPEDPNFYEDKNQEKEVCKSGGWWIWIDGNTTKDTENVIIYGHNMHYGMMFGSLKKYKKPSFYEDHKYIKFDTLYERGTYEIISVVKTKDYGEDESHYQFYDHMELDSEEEFQEYVDNAKKNAEFSIETTAEFGDRLITLSTCDGVNTDNRLLIIAKKIN